MTDLDRRALLMGGGAALLASRAGWTREVLPSAAGGSRLRSLEQAANGRLGAHVLDTATGMAFGHRERERFTQASSYKLSLAAMELAEAEAGRIDAGEVLHWKQEELLSYSPVTRVRLRDGLSLRDLARAALVTSDNTAANLLLRHMGGPARLTAFWRSIGDATSRIDRYEPSLNVTPPGTELDTTTPIAMATTAAALIEGGVLAPRSRAVLRGWMAEVATGRDRIRAGFPSDWASGDKTGTGGSDARRVYVDLAFGGPADRPPLIVAAYFEPALSDETAGARAAGVLAAVGRIAAGTLARSRDRDR